MIFLRSPYNYDTDAASVESGLECQDETLARQSFKEEADINTIVNRFMKTGVLPQAVNLPRYGDFSEAMDYHSALNLIMQADDAFMELPAELRARFENDPGQLLEFLQDEANRPEAEKLGLVAPQVVPVSEPESGDSPAE